MTNNIHNDLLSSNNHLVTSLKQLAQSQYGHLLASRTFADELTVEEKTYLKKAEFYGITLDKQYHCTLTNQHMIDAVNDWEYLLKKALELGGVDWAVGNYDPSGLSDAIIEEEEISEIRNRIYTDSMQFDYYSSRGC